MALQRPSLAIIEPAPVGTHALTLRETTKILHPFADDPATLRDCEQASALTWMKTCLYVEQRIASLARGARRRGTPA